MSQSYSAGVVTAYGAAVRGGYAGTYAEFCADLAALGVTLEELNHIQVVVRAIAPGETPGGSYQSGVLTLYINRGDKGDPGDAATIRVGTVSTGEPGSSAAVTNRGTTADAILDFTIPRGDKGDPGDSAYKQAQDGGYEGTEADFIALLGDLDGIDTRAAASASAAEASAQAAALSEASAAASAQSAGAAALNAYAAPTVSGLLANFDDGAEDVPVKSVKVTITPDQPGSGTPSPSNARPITARASLDVTRSGRNLFDQANALVYDRYISNISGRWLYFATDCASYAFPCRPNTAYTVSVFGEDITIFRVTECHDRLLDEANHEPFGGALRHNGAAAGSVSFTTAADATFLAIQINAGLIASCRVMVECGDTASDWEPYCGQTVTAALPEGGVCGGTLDLTTGTLRIDRALQKLNRLLNTAQLITLTGGRKALKLSVSGLPARESYTEADPRLLCSHYASVSQQAMEQGTDGICLSADRCLLLCDADKQTIAAWSDDDLDLVCPLESPLTVQLDPAELTTLRGVNRVWSDAGPVSLTYRADPTIIYNKLTAAILSLGGNV